MGQRRHRSRASGHRRHVGRAGIIRDRSDLESRRDIGLAVAKAAKAEGSDVVVVSSKQGRVDSALTLLGEGAEGYVTNLSDETAVEILFGKMGSFDHLVYTAGDSVWQRLVGEIKLEDAKTFFDVRFWGAFLVTKHASRLIRPGGSIVFRSFITLAGGAMVAALHSQVQGASIGNIDKLILPTDTGVRTGVRG